MDKKVMEYMNDISKEIRDLEQQLFSINFNQEKIYEMKDQIYYKIYSDVYNEKDEKDKNKFSNDTIREIETNTRLKNNSDYKNILDKLIETKQQYNECKSNIDHKKRVFRIYEVGTET